jgi:uncharacterized protein YndB with AHSA1/START domain
VHQEVLPASVERVFALLHTPSAIRAWWSAARAVVLAREDGIWASAWGADEDDPDYITTASIRVFDPPHRLVLADQRYHARSGALPFQADIVTEFSIVSCPEGAVLRVTQDGFPCDSKADDFYAACERGWKDTFAGIRRYLTSER